MSGYWQFPRADRRQFQRQAAIRNTRRGAIRPTRSVCHTTRLHGKHPPQHCRRSVLDFEPYRDGDPSDGYDVIIQPPGAGYAHVLTEYDIRSRLSRLPSYLLRGLHTVLLPRMTKKRERLHCLGLQYGGTIYIYPVRIPCSHVHFIGRLPPREAQWIRKFGGKIRHEADDDVVIWNCRTLKRFYRDHILIHELGHVVDVWNNSTKQRERFAEFFVDKWN